jgi:hypothetical protein
VNGVAVDRARPRRQLGIRAGPAQHALHPRFNRNGWFFWSESSTGADSNVLAEIALLGNRVDRFVWNGTTDHSKNLIRLRAFQADEGQPPRGNHNGGVSCGSRSVRPRAPTRRR